MRFEYQPGSGRIRLDSRTFEALASDTPPPSEVQRALVESGAVTPDGKASEDLAPLFVSVGDPLCALRVEVSGGAHQQVHQGWVRDDVAALLLAVSNDSYDFFGVLPESVPAAVARVVRLGPRKQVERAPTAVTRADLETAWTGEMGEVRRVLDQLGGREERWLWRAEMVWPQGDGESLAGRSVEGMAGPEGWWLLRQDSEDAGTYLPTTPTTLWQMFIDLLPGDAEIEKARGSAVPT